MAPCSRRRISGSCELESVSGSAIPGRTVHTVVDFEPSIHFEPESTVGRGINPDSDPCFAYASNVGDVADFLVHLLASFSEMVNVICLLWVAVVRDLTLSSLFSGNSNRYCSESHTIGCQRPFCQ